MKILIYISSLSTGGAEKVASLMANYWAKEHHVILLTDSPLDKDFFTIDSRVDRQTTNFTTTGISILKKILINFSALIQLRKIIKQNKPDLIISHLDISNVRILLSSAGLGIPTIVEDHNNPKFNPVKQPWGFFKPISYKWANRIVLLSKDLISTYPASLHDRISFIPNPLDIPDTIPDSSDIFLKQPSFIAMGRLIELKGFDYLLEAFSKVHQILPEWDLTILGEGYLREELTDYAIKLGISDSVNMPGRIKNPYSVLKDASVFVMSSRSEAFPVALCEAMGVGLPCISFNSPTGPADIIEHNVNGLLVEYLNVEALAETMIMLANDPVMQKRLSAEGRKINITLHLSTIMLQWDEIIQKYCRVAK